MNIKTFFVNHKTQIRNSILHLFGWFIFFSYPYLVLNMPFNFIPLEVRIIDSLFVLIVFYFNAYFLVPKLLLKKKYFYFAIILTFIIFLFSRFSDYTRRYIDPKRGNVVMRYEERVRQGNSVRTYKYEQRTDFEIQKRWMRHNHPRAMNMGMLLNIAISTSLGLMANYFREERRKKIVHNEKLKTELTFLKTQINPHFLFNVLNSIYSLSLKKSDKVPEIILKLSEMMRYMLYESEVNKVSLDKEIDYINNYISLQKLRVFENCTITFSVSDNTNGVTIAPMILIPFVENAFKHGISHTDDSPIDISLERKDSKLLFTVKNKLHKNLHTDKTGGIGIQNVKRRLELLYPDKHKLEIVELDNNFVVSLHLKLNENELSDN
ncbi:MAG: histidine kinase [Bacteroidales bacterium]|nr:histidine kinase [Bacteroidales bacterium]